MKIEFTDRNKMIDFEMELNDKGLLHNYSSRYSELVFDKNRYMREEDKNEVNNKIFNVAKNYGGKIIEL